jgi:hypothetical protein
MTLLSAFLISFFSPLCFIPPPEMMYNHDELIDNTDTILLVECTGIDTLYLKERQKKVFYVDYFVDYNFEIIEVLKGTSPKKYTRRNIRNVSYSSENFNNHNDSIFWNQAVGRSTIPIGACGASHSFRPGNKYLCFIGCSPNRKSSECVNDPNDAWLHYVRKSIKQK